MDLAMMAGHASFEPAIGTQVQVREDTVSGIEAPDVDLGGRWELNLTVRGFDPDPERYRRSFYRFFDSFTGPGIRSRDRQLLFGKRFGSQRAACGQVYSTLATE